MQATLPTEPDQRLVEIYLDPGERTDGAVTYQHRWAATIVNWLSATA